MFKAVLYVVGAMFFGTLFTALIFITGLILIVLLAAFGLVSGDLENGAVACGLPVYLLILHKLQGRIQTWPKILRSVLFVCLPTITLLLLYRVAPLTALTTLSAITTLVCYQWIVTTFRR